MNPILYDSTETSFSSNGLGRLTDCLECVCHEERNGIFEVDFTYPIDGKNYDLIKIGRSIGVRHDDSEDIQPFDIVSYSKPIDGIVSFHAVHISYRTAALVASARNITSLSAALSTMVASAQPSSEMRFSLSADFESNGYMAAFDGTPRSVRQLLGGVEGSVLDTYGGEYEFNKFDIVLHKRRGIDREFRIKYGVNLLSYKDDTDAQGTFSACIPFWKNNDAIVVGDIVDSGLPTMSGREDCAPLDLSDKFEGKPTKAQLEALALTYMQNRQTAIPKTSISVDFVRLQDIGFSGFDSLYECKLCDTIGVDFPRYGMSGRFKIVKTESSSRRSHSQAHARTRSAEASASGLTTRTRTQSHSFIISTMGRTYRAVTRCSRFPKNTAQQQRDTARRHTQQDQAGRCRTITDT